MLTDITLGQYYPGNSFLHRMDPRAKIDVYKRQVYSPALMDFVYMVKGTSQMFLTGPKVVESVTGEQISAEDLGGAMTHNSISGVSQFAAEDDEDCIRQIRYLLSFLPGNNMEDAPVVDTGDDPARTDPALDHIIPDEANMAYDMYDIIKSLVDNGEYYEVLKHWAKNAITAFARMDGQTVGVVANQPKMMAGCLDLSLIHISIAFSRKNIVRRKWILSKA